MIANTTPNANHVLGAENLVLAYDKTDIIHDLELSVETGKVTALIGPNGCGKSTLLRGLARLMKAKSGCVTLDGKEIGKVPTKQIAKRLGLLPQGPNAPEGLTVRELVAQGRYPHQGFFQQWSKEDERALQEALATTTMTGFADRPLDALSGGQRQRAWIAMTLAQETDTLLLDEPTTFLDLAYQIEVMDLLAQLNQRQGTSIIVVLHDLNQAARYAHTLVVMKAGHIFVQGEPKDVMTSETLKEVFGVNACVIQDPVSGTPMCIPMGKNCPRKQ